MESNQTEMKTIGFEAEFLVAMEALNTAGIKACLMRDDPDFLGSTLELDLLVSADKLVSVLDVLASCGWVMIDTGTFIPLKRALVRFRSGNLLKIDLHLALIDGALVYMDADWMLDTAIQTAEGYWLPSSESWYLHVLLHSILGKPKLHEKYHARVRQLLQIGIDFELVERKANQFGLKTCLAHLWSDPINLLTDVDSIKQLRWKVRLSLLRAEPSNFKRLFFQRLRWRFGQWSGTRRGFVIAVIGPDGAGKTTFLGEMKKSLRRMEIPSRTVYMGPWEYPILFTSHWIRKLGASPLDRIANTDNSVAPLRRCTKLLKGVSKRYLYYSNILFELWTRYVLKVWPQLQRRRVVIADRYAYDLEVGYYNSLVNNSRVLRRVIANLIPRPAFTILLDNDVEIIWERKKEYPKEVIAQSLSRYKEIAERRKFHVIKTDEPVETIVFRFIQEHWVDMILLRKDGARGDKVAWYEFNFSASKRKTPERSM